MTNPMRRVAPWMAFMISFPLLAHANGHGKWVRKEASGPAPGFSLTNQDGRKVSLEDFRGKVVLINFIYTHCETACPLTTAKLASLYSAWKGKDLHIVSITIDPAHDTPAVLKEYGKQWKGVDFRSWSFLTGTTEQVEPVLFDYKIEVNRGGKKDPSGAILTSSIVDHGVKTFLIDRDGMKRFEYWGQDFDTKAVIKDLTAVVGKG